MVTPAELVDPGWGSFWAISGSSGKFGMKLAEGYCARNGLFSCCLDQGKYLSSTYISLSQIRVHYNSLSCNVDSSKINLLLAKLLKKEGAKLITCLNAFCLRLGKRSDGFGDICENKVLLLDFLKSFMLKFQPHQE